MANTIPSELQFHVMMQSALRAFKRRVLPLSQLSTVFRDVPLKGTNKVQVPYYALVGTASTDFNGTYSFGNTTTSSREVHVNKRKYQSLSITSEEWNRQPNVDWEMHGTLKGEKLAEDVIADIFSIVTAANFGAAASVGLASAFDSDDVATLRGVANKAHWPKAGRSLIIDSDYDVNLQKDDSVKHAMNFGGDGVIRRGELEEISGFSYFESPLIPANGENLKGFIAYRSAILTAFSPITPTPNVMSELARYQQVTDTDTGITLEYREWGDAVTDSDKRIIECNYGYGLGEAEALKRITSA